MIRVEALAKINLDLRVLARRADGYHELRTIFQTISLADVLEMDFFPGPHEEIEIEGNTVIEDNLIGRAARLVLEESGLRGRVHFKLEKRIPMGAGLGGGSSDAAAVLRALPRLTGVPIPSGRLHQLAALLGSDVPFFLYGGTALGMGRGDEVYPLPAFPPLHGLLVTPSVHVSTPEAYQALSARLDAAQVPAKLAEFASVAWSRDLAQARNDFEQVVFEMHPALGAIRDSLERAGAVCARMTGSGSAVFGLFQRLPEAFTSEHHSHPFSLVSQA